MNNHLMLLTSSILYLWTFLNSDIKKQICPSGGMGDAGDSKSPDGNIVWVRLPPWAPRDKDNGAVYKAYMISEMSE